MSATPRPANVWRLSLRELFVLVALIALAIVSLKYASDVWLFVVATLTIGVFIVAAIAAVIERGTKQAFRIGIVLTMVIYHQILWNSPVVPVRDANPELMLAVGRLPTTTILREMHEAIADKGYFDPKTGKSIPNYDPSAGIGSGLGGIPATYRETPPRELFVPIGHCWWALLLGYLGGWFATFVYQRRMREQST